MCSSSPASSSASSSSRVSTHSAGAGTISAIRALAARCGGVSTGVWALSMAPR
ncbi:hypothetical protein ACFQ9X_28550 [Catenulispora yoronensis]